VADSFEGLPPPDATRFPADRRSSFHVFRELAVSEAEVRRNFAAYDLLDEQVVFVKGFFEHTLAGIPAERFALARLDGDMYQSTMEGLMHLYGRLSEGGFIVIDDYGALSGCRQAVHEFRDANSIKDEIRPIDGSAVWWQKSRQD
jgi:hypothetical protein